MCSDNRSSSHTDNRKNNILVLRQGPAQGINDNTGLLEKKFSINFRRANTKVYLSLYYKGDESYFCVNKTEICKFKAKDNKSRYSFCLASISKNFIKDEQRKISLNGTVSDFSVDHQLKKKTFVIFPNI